MEPTNRPRRVVVREATADWPTFEALMGDADRLEGPKGQQIEQGYFWPKGTISRDSICWDMWFKVPQAPKEQDAG
jgi:hypothetical protein